MNSERIARIAASVLQNPLDNMTRQKAVKIVNHLLTKHTAGFFTDEYWKPVNKAFDELDKAGITCHIVSTEYKKNENGVNASKTWTIEVPFTNQRGMPTVLRGVIVASGGGSIADPLDRYDVVAYVS